MKCQRQLIPRYSERISLALYLIQERVSLATISDLGVVIEGKQ